MIETELKFEVSKLHKHLNFYDKFDFEGQGQGQQLQTCPKPLDDQ